MILPPNLTDSQIFTLVAKTRVLAHPTSAAFHPEPWIAALDGLGEKTVRDVALATSALHFGREIQSLRRSLGVRLTHGLSRSAGLRLLAATANQQYLTLVDKVQDTLKASHGQYPVHLEQLDQTSFENVGGQSVTADGHATALVDMLPHWLHHLLGIAAEADGSSPKHPDHFVGPAIMTASIERALRDLWQQALWEGHWLDERAGITVHTPADYESAEQWFVWELRQQSLLGQEMYLDVAAHILSDGKLPPAAPVVARTVVKVVRPGKKHRRFKIGKVSGRNPRDRVRASEHEALERLYVGLFLDEPLPKLGDLMVSCRLLNQAWWVISDLVRLLARDAGTPWFEDDRGVGRFAFAIEREQLCKIVADCLAISGERGTAIVDFLELDLTDTGWLFGRGFWATPLLPDESRGRLYLIAAPLMVGSPTRRVEAWLEKGGLTDRAGIKGRGKPFEDHVRKQVTEALSKNPILKDHGVAPFSLKRKGGSEEIDLLIRVGNTLLVGEVKCFVFPSEPLERFNYLSNVLSAIEQAKAKLRWAEENRTAIAEQVGVLDTGKAQFLSFVPIVVMNYGFGLGLVVDGVAVTELHYLRLLMKAGEYQSDTRFEKGVGVIYQTVTLYRDQSDFETRLTELFAEPPPLRRYKGKVGWKRVPFTTSDLTPFEIELPLLSDIPMNPAALENLEKRAAELKRAAQSWKHQLG